MGLALDRSHFACREGQVCGERRGDMTAISRSIPNDRMAVLFAIMLVAAAGNTAMQSILPAIGAKLHIPYVWVSLAFSWSARLWVLTAPHWARPLDTPGRTLPLAREMPVPLLSLAWVWAS